MRNYLEITETTKTRQIKKRASSPGPGQRTPNKVTIQQLKQSFPDVDDFKARTPKLEKKRKFLIDDNQVRIHSSTSIYLCNDTDHSQEDNETFTSESQEKAPDGAPNPSPNRWARGTPIRETTKNKHSVTINLEGQKFKQSPPPDQKIFQILVTIAHAKQGYYKHDPLAHKKSRDGDYLARTLGMAGYGAGQIQAALQLHMNDVNLKTQGPSRKIENLCRINRASQQPPWKLRIMIPDTPSERQAFNNYLVVLNQQSNVLTLDYTGPDKKTGKSNS